MKLYNTLTRQIEELKPLNPPNIGIYTCGPTVYDFAHVGHWFTYIRNDILIRTLKSSGLHPNWIMNITDVGHLVSDSDEGEDKLEKGAKREGKTAWEVAEFYTNDFLECMKLLNISHPNHMPKATDHISEQIELIKKLEEKNYTYKIDDGIYYDTSKFAKYAEFARLDLDEQQAGARVAFNPQKRNVSDFALWKFSPDGSSRDMEWESPWGKGFPGWHIECSAMSMKYLGDTIDIHTGGIDHIPVHHANEIAQSEAITGKTFSNHWLHTNHVLVDGQKISKSLGNGIRLQEVIKRGVPAEAFRLHVLESHYRSQSKFSWDSLGAANNRLKDLRAFSALRWQTSEHAEPKELFAKASDQIRSLMQDDLNTPAVMAYLSSITSEVLQSKPSSTDKPALDELIDTVDKILGLQLGEVNDISDSLRHKISQREEARQQKDWTKSDEIRDQLLEQGVGLNDTPLGAIWFFV